MTDFADRPTPPWPDAVRLDHQRASIEADFGGVLMQQEVKSTLRYVSLDFVIAVLADADHIDEDTAERIIQTLT
jgi:hypothetical protein